MGEPGKRSPLVARFLDVPHTEAPDELPVQRSRRVLAQRPSPIPIPAQSIWRNGARTALLAFTRQVLLRPARIGTLALLGAMIATVLVGAESWWIVLGISLFHVAAGTLTAMWVDIPRAGVPQRVEPLRTWFVRNHLPHQRRPRPDE